MVGNALIEATAKWIVREWKDDLIFPNYLDNSPKELKRKLVSYYITWALRNGDVKKAFLASKLFGEKIIKSVLKDARDYIAKTGKYAAEKKYLVKEDLVNLAEHNIKITEVEALNLLKLQQPKIEEIAGISNFFEDKEDPLGIYLNLCIERCESAIERKDLNQFSSWFSMLLELPIPEKAASLVPKVNAFYLGDLEKLFGKFNKFITSYKKKTLSNLSKKADNWLNSILSFYPELIKEEKGSSSYSYILGNIVEPYLKYFQYSKATVDKLGYLFISNNIDVSPWRAIECFNASNNKKMKKRLEVVETKNIKSFSQQKLEKLLQNALKEADLFSKEGLYLVAFKLVESAQDLVDRNKKDIPFINKIIENKIKLALIVLKNTGKFPTMYHMPSSIIEDIQRINDDKFYTDVLREVLISKPFLIEDFIFEFFSKRYDLFDKAFIIETIENQIKDKSELSKDYHAFKLIEHLKNKFSKDEMEKFAGLFEGIHDYYHAIQIHKLLNPKLANLTEELRKNNPNLTSLDLGKKENKILSGKNNRIKALLKKQERENKYKQPPEINEQTLAEDLNKSYFYVTNKKRSQNLGITRKISGDSTFKKLYAFVERTALLKQQIEAMDLDADIPMDEDAIYPLEIPVLKQEKLQKEVVTKKKDILITFNTGPRIRREAKIKLADATPLQKKLIKYQLLKQIKHRNWQEFFMCGNAVPEVDKASYYFKIIENHLKDYMKLEKIDNSITNKFKDEIDKEIIKVFLIYQEQRNFLD